MAIGSDGFLENVFLSASIPKSDRNPIYYDSADFVAIREAVIAIATVVVPDYRLIWGGHPAITPLIRNVYQRLLDEEAGKHIGEKDFRSALKEHVRIYQSRFFEKSFPEDNEAFEDKKIMECDPSDMKKSLADMRKAMIYGTDEDRIVYKAAFFIGGMEGIQDEYDMFVEYHPDIITVPIASTGAAAAILYEKEEPLLSDMLGHELMDRLRYDRSYISLFSDILSQADRLNERLSEWRNR